MGRLAFLDYARFLAALVVVLFHYSFNGILNGNISSVTELPEISAVTKYGYLGVELFFMISGYVIFFSARGRSAAKFAAGRAIRLYPSYWCAVCITTLVYMLWGDVQVTASLLQAAVNLSMLQTLVGVAHVDGVYWTLLFELSFYAAVFVLLLLGLQDRLESIFLGWVVVFVLAIPLGLHKLPYLGGYYYFFCAGAVFAIARHRLDWKVMVALLVMLVLCVGFAAGKHADLSSAKGVDYSPWVIGVVVAGFFAFFTWQNTATAMRIQLPLSETAGALTYPVYLIHAGCGYLLLSNIATADNLYAAFLLALVLTLLAAYLMHAVIEVRLAFLWRALFASLVERPVVWLQARIAGFQARALKRP